MSAMAYRGYDRHHHGPGYDYDSGYEYGSRRHDGGNAAATVIQVVTGLVVTIFVLHVVFVLAGANKGNGIVYFVHQMAKALVLGFGDVFTPDDAAIGVALNYGLAAIVYFVVGQLIVRALRRR